MIFFFSQEINNIIEQRCVKLVKSTSKINAFLLNFLLIKESSKKSIKY